MWCLTVAREMYSSCAISAFSRPSASRRSQALFTDTRRPGGGRPLPAHRVYRLVREHLRPGTPLVRTTSSSPSVVALGTPRVTLLVNARPRVVVVQLEGAQRRLAPYAVRVVPVRGTRTTGGARGA